VHNLDMNWFIGSSFRSCGTWNMKFSVGYWHCKKLERNRKVASISARERSSCCCSLRFGDKWWRRGFSLSFLVYNILHCLTSFWSIAYCNFIAGTSLLLVWLQPWSGSVSQTCICFKSRQMPTSDHKIFYH
jgi:hypothetical protein